TNTGSMIGTWISTSGLGFVYWWLAARLFPADAIGVGAAMTSAMMLLGMVGVLGLDTLLIGELARRRENAASLLCAGLLVVGVVGGIIGLSFSVFAPVLSAHFALLRASMGETLLFAGGVSLTAIAIVLDQALIGLLQGVFQL